MFTATPNTYVLPVMLVLRLQVDAYIRQLLGLPPREPQPPPRAAAAAAPADTAEPSEGNGRRNRGTVQAEQVSQRLLLVMPAVCRSAVAECAARLVWPVEDAPGLPDWQRGCALALSGAATQALRCTGQEAWIRVHMLDSDSLPSCSLSLSLTK